MNRWLYSKWIRASNTSTCFRWAWPPICFRTALSSMILLPDHRRYHRHHQAKWMTTPIQHRPADWELKVVCCRLSSRATSWPEFKIRPFRAANSKLAPRHRSAPVAAPPLPLLLPLPPPQPLPESSLRRWVPAEVLLILASSSILMFRRWMLFSQPRKALRPLLHPPQSSQQRANVRQKNLHKSISTSTLTVDSNPMLTKTSITSIKSWHWIQLRQRFPTNWNVIKTNELLQHLGGPPPPPSPPPRPGFRKFQIPSKLH